MPLELDAPDTVDAPLSVWQIGYGSEHPQPLDSRSKYIKYVSVQFTAPDTGSVVRDATVSLEGPGTVTPTSETNFDVLWPGQTVTATWRWAIPAKAQPPPFSMPLTAEANFTSGDHRSTEIDEVNVDVQPPAPPTEDSYVSDLPLCYEINGYGPIKRDTWNGGMGPKDGAGEPIELDGETYEKGLGVHAFSIAGVYLGGNAATFTSTIGVDDRKESKGEVIFLVVGDGETLYQSDTITGSTPAEPISVDVTGVEQLELVVDNAGHTQPHNVADWADAHITYSSK